MHNLGDTYITNGSIYIEHIGTDIIIGNKKHDKVKILHYDSYEEVEKVFNAVKTLFCFEEDD